MAAPLRGHCSSAIYLPYVNVNDALPMCEVECSRDLGGDLHCVVEGELAFALDSGAERFAVDVRHHEEQRLVDLARVVNRQNVRMRQVAGDLDLTTKSLGAEGRRKIFVQDFDGDVPVVLDVVREINSGHAAAPDLTLDEIAGREAVSEPSLIHGERRKGVGEQV